MDKHSLLNSLKIEFTKPFNTKSKLSYLFDIFENKDPNLIVIDNLFLEKDIKELTSFNHLTNEISDLEKKEYILNKILLRTKESYHNSTMIVVCSRMKEHSTILKEIANYKESGGCLIQMTKGTNIDFVIEIESEIFSFNLPPHTPDSVSIAIIAILINLLKKEH